MLRRNLHNWNMTIRWHRIGIKRDPPFDNVRQDFTFQINLIAEPAASVGVGYDATTDTWESVVCPLASLTTPSVSETHLDDPISNTKPTAQKPTNPLRLMLRLSAKNPSFFLSRFLIPMNRGTDGKTRGLFVLCTLFY